MATEPLLDAAEIQGHILPGYTEIDLLLLALRADDSGSLKAVIRDLREDPGVTTMRSAFPLRSARKRFKQGVGDEPDDPLRLNLAFTRQGLDRLGFAQSRGTDPAFDGGMTCQSTGAPRVQTQADGSPEPAHPTNWVVGGPLKHFDLLILLGCKRSIHKRTAAISEKVKAMPGISVIYEEFGEDLPDSTEHFGYADGISQPGVYGEYEDTSGQRVPVTTRYGVPPVLGWDFGKPGQPLVWPGRFLVGAPRHEGDFGENAPDIFRNGSFLVFRRLQQDVAAFYRDTDKMAKELASRLCRPDIDGAFLRDFIVGRRQNGQPLMRPGAGHDRPLAINHFFYTIQTPALTLNSEQITGTTPDPRGERCPFWAHIRKVNPRDGHTDLDQRTHNVQMLRRGIPFGPPFNHQLAPDDPNNQRPRGLLFMAYQRHIGDQFVQLNSQWMNQFENPDGRGHDLLVGLPLTPSGELAPRQAEWPCSGETLVTPTRPWVIPTGGAYLFAPSLTGLNLLLEGPN